MPDIHPTAQVHQRALIDEGATVGARSRIWAFAHILKGAVVGDDCNICDHTFIEGAVRIGNRVTLKCGVYLWDGLTVEDDAFIGPNATFTNDLRPRSRAVPNTYPQTTLLRGATIGANSTILPGLTIGQWSFIAAGAVVTRSVPDFALYVGNPARFMGWVCRCGHRLAIEQNRSRCVQCDTHYAVHDSLLTLE